MKRLSNLRSQAVRPIQQNVQAKKKKKKDTGHCFSQRNSALIPQNKACYTQHTGTRRPLKKKQTCTKKVKTAEAVIDLKLIYFFNSWATREHKVFIN